MFKTQNFCHIASNNRNNVKAGVFIYRTTDDLATVSASGYFNDRIIDLKLHDIIIHEQIDASDATKVKQNFLCVVERTLTNVKVKIMDTDEVDGADTDLSNLTTTGYANISAKGTYNASATYASGTVGAAIKEKVNIDGSSIMTAPLKMRAGSMRGAIGPYLNGVGFWKMASDNTITQIATLSDTQFVPVTTNAIDLGSSTKSWKDIYASKIQGDAANIASWAKNTTNGVESITRKFNFGIANGVLTLKSGSTVYVPNGTDVFDAITTTSDLTISSVGSGSTNVMIFYSNGSLMARPVSDCFSGATQPTVTTTTAEWYDTANNVIKHTADTGSTWTTPGTSLPICECSRSSGTLTGIVNIFEGFGYIGSTVFALPGITVSMPHGRTSSDLLDSTHYTTTAVSISSESYNETVYNLDIGLGPAGISLYNYNYSEMFNIVGNGSIAIVGNADFVGGKVTRFYTNYPFRAVDYSDRRFIAHQAMPSRNYIDLTLGASGDTYTAPADGYITLAKTADGSDQYISLRNISTNQSTNCFIPGTGLIGRATIPVSKNDGINVTYTAGGTTTTFRFIFANGIK